MFGLWLLLVLEFLVLSSILVFEGVGGIFMSDSLFEKKVKGCELEFLKEFVWWGGSGFRVRLKW